MKSLLLTVTLLLPATAGAAAAPTAKHHAHPAAVADAATLAVGRFGTVSVYRPSGAPRSVVLFLSGDGGWNLGVVSMARELRDAGALVVGLDIRHYLAQLAKPTSSCNYLAEDFENLSHVVQKRLAMRAYIVPMLVGYSSGATVVYAALVQSPPGTFAGAVSLGFCPDQDMKKIPVCSGHGLKYTPNKRGDFVFEPAPQLQDRWIALQGQQDVVCDAKTVDRFAAAIGAPAQVVPLASVGHGFSVERNWLPQLLAAQAELAARAEPPKPIAPEVSDLPLTEVPSAPAQGEGSGEQRLALLLTGDGGWAGLDRELSRELAQQGVPVVGLNSLKYFWHERKPEEVERDVERVLRHYLDAWHKERILLVGYSFGADVLPFVVERLPADLRARIAGISLIGLSQSASFEVHVSDWLPGAAGGDVAVAPQVAKLRGLSVACFYGEGESDTPCPALGVQGVAAVQIGKGHHLGGEYADLAKRILALP
jgi:type IV secretory pathway VirJ component